ncbi:hypothetical protein ACMHYB_10750 [Sorangium sp. So ce1128]
MHELHGFAPPTNHPLVMAWRRRLIDAGSHAPQKAAELTAAQLAQMMAAMGGALVDLRDRALLLVGYAARLRRAELVGLNVADVVHREEGLELLVPRGGSSSRPAITRSRAPRARCGRGSTRPRWRRAGRSSSGLTNEVSSAGGCPIAPLA